MQTCFDSYRSDDDDYDFDVDYGYDDDDDDDNNNNNNNNNNCGNTRRQKCFAKGSGKEVKIQEFIMYRDTTNVEPEMYDCTGNNWSHWNSNEKKEKSGSCTRKTFDRFTTKDSYTWNITHNTESIAV